MKKKEFLNKNFLPDEIYEKQMKSQLDSERIKMFFSLIVFCILLPITISQITEDEYVENIANEVEDTEEEYYEDFISWINIYNKDAYGEFNLQDGEIIVKEEEDIVRLCKLDNFKVKDIILEEDNKYKVIIGRR